MCQSHSDRHMVFLIDIGLQSIQIVASGEGGNSTVGGGGGELADGLNAAVTCHENAGGFG